MKDLKDCSRQDLIRIIAKMQSGIGEFFNSSTGYDRNKFKNEETSIREEKQND